MDEILDLSTKQERPKIRIDDVLYELRLPTDLELRDVLWLQRAAKRMGYLEKQLEKDVVSDAVGDEFQAMMDRFANLILGEVPEKVLALLSDLQRMAVVNTYSKLIKEQRESFFDQGVDSVKEKKEDGSASSPSSSASTEETSRAG